MRLPGSFRQTLANFALPIAFAWVAVASFHALYAPVDPTVFAPKAHSFGAIRMRLKLPGTWGGIDEPILICGKPGKASLVYIKLFYHAKAKVGIEFWGFRAFESPEFDLPAQDAQIELACSIPALYPAAGDPEWQAMSAAAETHLLRNYIIAVDGVVRLSGQVDYGQDPHMPVYLGVNPLGGSFVSNEFTGKILSASQKH